jgi:hypothetical protein
MAIKEEIMSDDNQIIQEEQQVDTVLNEEQVEQVVDSADELAEKVKTLEQEQRLLVVGCLEIDMELKGRLCE